MQLRHRIEKNKEAFCFNSTNIYVFASLLKVCRQLIHIRLVLLTLIQMYLQELPEPLFKFSLEDRIQHTDDFGWDSLHPVVDLPLTEVLSEKNAMLQISSLFM